MFHFIFHLDIGTFDQGVDNKRLTIVDLLRPAPMMLRTLNLFLQWFSVTMTFYGLTFASATLELAGNVYINFTLNVLVEFIAAAIGYLCIDKFGRRPFMIGTQLVSGICVLICGNMVNVQVSYVMFETFGRLIISNPFFLYLCIYIYQLSYSQPKQSVWQQYKHYKLFSIWLENYWPVFVLGCVIFTHQNCIQPRYAARRLDLAVPWQGLEESSLS